MSKTTGFLTKSLTATTRIPAHTLVTFGPADGTGVPSSGTGAMLVGASSEIDTEIGERCSVHSTGNIAPVLCGGNVSRGDPLTSDANGRAITANAAGQRIVGFAEVSGVAGDIIFAYIVPGIF
jgi:hypothetical protein